MESTDPLSIILVSSGSRGDRLLFRFPFETEELKVASDTVKGPLSLRNPYGVRIAEDYNEWCIHESVSNISSGALVGYSDKMLCNLLVARADLCQRQFEIKVNDVVFVGYPMQLHRDSVSLSHPKRDQTMISFNVVFALQASAADESLISCYQDLAKQLALALRHENKRCDYLDKQKSLMMAIQEEVSTMPEDSYVSPYALMIRKCPLAKQLQFIYESICESGMVFLHINKWIQINFCLPHKVHNLHLPKDSNAYIKPEGLTRCLEALRPYHAMLLLEDEETMLNGLPLDSSPSLTRLIQVASPLKSLQTLALDSDLSLLQISQLVTHLVYWGKAIIIYPLCESNTYMLAPHTNTFVQSSLSEKFTEQFPQMSLAAVLADFSLPTTLGEHRDVLGLPKHHAQQVQMVVWMLKHQLLMQLHTYIFLFPSQPRHLVFPPSSPLSIGPGPSGFETLARIRAQSVLTPVAEDVTLLHRAASVSDIHSGVTTGSSPTHTHSSYSTRFPSVEISEGEVMSSEIRLQDSLLRGLSDQQKQNIMKVPAATNQDDLKMFTRLCKYFDGKHHLEEIMFYENVRRSTLLTLIDKFREVLVTCQHEDPRISCWRQR